MSAPTCAGCDYPLEPTPTGTFYCLQCGREYEHGGHDDGHNDPHAIVSELATATAHGRPWRSESWAEFRDASPNQPRWLIEGLLPESALAFLSARPKEGKTWLALGCSLALSTGLPLFGRYAVPDGGRPVLYVALEGSRQALRARIGALARGMGIDPDDHLALAQLRMLYRPRPFNLTDLADTRWLQEETAEYDAALVFVDVLRRAAPINENSAEDFAKVRDALEPLLAEGLTVALLHHFAKLTDSQKDRLPGERMSGTGAMFGALDVGLYITKSESGARRLRVEVEARDFATPDPLGVVILGTGTGEHDGFTYLDTATMALDAGAAEERDLAAELEALFTDGAWRTETELASKKHGIGANRDDVKATLHGAPERFLQVSGLRVGRHVNAQPWGTSTMFHDLGVLLEASSKTEQDEQDGGSNTVIERVAPLRGDNTSNTFDDVLLLPGRSEQDKTPHPGDALEAELFERLPGATLVADDGDGWTTVAEGRYGVLRVRDLPVDDIVPETGTISLPRAVATGDSAERAVGEAPRLDEAEIERLAARAREWAAGE